MLRLAACLEEHFPPPWPTPWWRRPAARGSPTRSATPGWEYLVAHGIASSGGWGAGAHRQRPLHLRG